MANEAAPSPLPAKACGPVGESAVGAPFARATEVAGPPPGGPAPAGAQPDRPPAGDEPDRPPAGDAPDRPPDDELPADLLAALRVYAMRERMLVALDFDGALAPIVPHPDAARPLAESAAAIGELVRRPGVTVALVSGRSLTDLRKLAAPPPQVLLVGSHGAQVELAGGVDGGPAARLSGLARALLTEVTAALQAISERYEGTFVEVKPAGAVLHTRQADPEAAALATKEALSGPAARPGVFVTRGKEVVDLSVVNVTKGAAVLRLRAEQGLPSGFGGVLYVGDDVTDERAFAVLDDTTGDVTIKVGPGTTAARHRVGGPRAVGRLLHHLVTLVDLRTATARAGERSVPRPSAHRSDPSARDPARDPEPQPQPPGSGRLSPSR